MVASSSCIVQDEEKEGKALSRTAKTAKTRNVRYPP